MSQMPNRPKKGNYSNNNLNIENDSVYNNKYDYINKGKKSININKNEKENNNKPSNIILAL